MSRNGVEPVMSSSTVENDHDAILYVQFESPSLAQQTHRDIRYRFDFLASRLLSGRSDEPPGAALRLTD